MFYGFDDFLYFVLLVVSITATTYCFYLLMRGTVDDELDLPAAFHTAPQKRAPKEPPAKKEAKALTEEQQQLKVVKKQYAASKVARDNAAAAMTACEEPHAEEAERLARLVARFADKAAVQDEEIKTLRDRIKKYSDKSSHLDTQKEGARASVEEEDAALQELKDALDEVFDTATTVEAETEAAVKAEADARKALRSEQRGNASLQYKVEGAARKSKRIEKENAFLKREIEYRLDRVREREESRRWAARDSGKKGARGGKKGGKQDSGKQGRGYSSWDDGYEQNGYRSQPRQEEEWAMVEPEEAVEETPPPPVAAAAQVTHTTFDDWADEGEDDQDMGIGEMLEQAIANPSGRWIDELEADEWRT